MLFIGNDDNVKQKNVIVKTESLERKLSSDSKDNEPTSSLSFEALSTLEQLQNQLIETEDRAQAAEERAFLAETALKEANERVRALERSVSRMESKSEVSTPQLGERNPSLKKM